MCDDASFAFIIKYHNSRLTETFNYNHVEFSVYTRDYKELLYV